MSNPTAAPYGSWKSPITADVAISDYVVPGQIRIDTTDIYWLELRPVEGGRYVIVRRTPDGDTSDITPETFSARTKVHEYGGGQYIVQDGVIYFSNFGDQRIYRQTAGEDPLPLTDEAEMRYADGKFDQLRSRIIYVREDHTGPGEAVNTLVGIGLEQGGVGEVLVSGSDFYSSPRLSPDGSKLAWLSWNHPNMPWDGTELWVADIAESGTLEGAQLVAGSTEESIFQPEWSPDGVLHFVSDRNGWWNLYRWSGGEAEPLLEMEAEFGAPQWLFGWKRYDFESAEKIICTYKQMGSSHLARLDTGSKQLELIETPYSTIWEVWVRSGEAVFIAGSPTEPSSVVKLDLESHQIEVLRRGREVTIDAGYFSMPESIEFPTEGGRTAYAIYYPPRNQDFTGPQDEKPPLVVMSHGGPTGSTSTVLDYDIQYLTSRGIAVVDVNYGGSTGYGRKYRERLDSEWGVVDVDDCVNAAKYLADRGIVDGDKLAINGGSAGGYTTLAALTFRDVFSAGASHFGISDLETMTQDTHKFESRYLDRLVGPYPERADIYRERSPIHFIDQLTTPIILLQGLEDEIVPPDQSEKMFEAVRAKGIPTAYLPFEGEQHGFRKAENVKRALEAELYFYSKVFGFDLADEIEPVAIANL
jgi:dipeptidyl aminopeptidase/acylaminoacyl peptidase